MNFNIKDIFLLALMLFASALGYLMHPQKLLADGLPSIELMRLVPTSFGEWTEDTNQPVLLVNPAQKEIIEKIYTQTLSRTYVNSNGYRIMLSIAYGRNQSQGTLLHKPEVCYPAQGFEVTSSQVSSLKIAGNSFSVKRLGTKLGARVEPLIYWIVVGDRVASTTMDMRLIELRYAAKNFIPDAMLIRISSIDNDVKNANLMQSVFANEMISAIEPNIRHRFIGMSKNK